MNEKICRIGIFLGGMRCGSTAFRDYLMQHPQVCMHTTKDPHYFSSDKCWEQGIDHYLDGWNSYETGKHLIAVESSTHYTKSPLYPNTAARMVSLGLDLRLVYSVRDPIDRIESHMIHNAGKGYFDPDNIEDRQKTLVQAINVSKYSYQLSAYEKYFPPEKLLVITTEDLISQPDNVLSSICSFFDIDSAFEFEKFPRRPRRFKKVVDVNLTDAEELFIRKELTDDVKMFVKHYDLNATSWRILN